VKLIFILLFLSGKSIAQPTDKSEMNRFVAQLLSKMTIEEKIGQLQQVTADMLKTGSSDTPLFKELIAKGQVGSVLNAFSVKVLRELQTIAISKSRNKIPLLFGLDVVSAYRNFSFPIPLAQSSSWDLVRIEKTEHILATEAAADGLDWTFAPMVDISRDPRWGRVAEGAGEDPWLGAEIAAARVRGFQGTDLSADDSLLACVKHFAGYGAPIGGRDYNSVEISPRVLFETYLPPYQAAVKAGAASVMTSFNDLDGMPSSGNRWLLHDLLRNQWGFNGLVVSDFSSIRQMVNHGVAENDKEAALLAIQAGVDVDMESHAYTQNLAELVTTKRVSPDVVDESVKRVLEAKYKRGLFQDPFRHMNAERAAKAFMTDEDLAFAREMAQRSIVLLKNEGNVLPLQSGIVAVVGPMAKVYFNNFDSTLLKAQQKAVNLIEGLERVNNGRLKLIFAKGAILPGEPSEPNLLAEAVEVATKADVILVHIGEPEAYSGEAASRTHLRIPSEQQLLLKTMHELGKPVVLILSNGRPLALEDDVKNANAILETWFLGTQAGNAIADILLGDFNPSGKLTMSFPYNEGQVPIYYNEKSTGIPFEAKDKYTTKYLDAPNEALFPFGFGLSYSNFLISVPMTNTANLKWGDSLKVHVQVENKSDRDGEEVVQLYIHNQVASLTRPVKELRGFRKIFVKKGDKANVEFTIQLEDLKFYNREMKWVAEPGRFSILVGPDSANLKATDFKLLAQKQ
jgi:beta-glucosidase